MSDWKACERKWSWSNLRWETSVLIAGLRTEIRTRDLPNTKQVCLPVGGTSQVPCSWTCIYRAWCAHQGCSERLGGRHDAVSNCVDCAPADTFQPWSDTAQITQHIRYGHVTDSEGWKCFTRATASVSQTQNTCVPLSGSRPYWRTSVPLISQSVNRHWPVPWSSHNYKKRICSMFFISQFVR
jgi:hypothetical protein